MFEDLIYDIVRDWIRDQRKDDLSWADIDNAKGKLSSFLEMNEEFNHWPHMSEEEWHQLVKLQKESEEETLAIKSRQESATISDQYEENAVTEIPPGSATAWQTYRRKLISKGFNEATIDEIERASFKLIKKLSLNTTEIGPRKGLVIGNVQSGKTANMAALMAMAADWGWNMFIVLSGTIENLRRQTQERLFGDLYDGTCRLNWNSLEQLKANMSPGYRAQDKNFEANQRFMTVCLKNATRLRNLIRWLQEDPHSQSKMKILVIDDEADQAGINTASIQNPNARKTISKLICALVNGKNFKNEDIKDQYKAMNYIAYTATPYANVLNEHSEESIYPRNFISALSISKEYFGPQQIFGCEDTDYDGLNIIRKITDDDLNNIKDIHNGNSRHIPNSLRDAVCWFMCCVACQRQWGYTKPVSMLIHTSQKTSHHDHIAKVVYNWIRITPAVEIIRQCETVWENETREFDKVCLREQYHDYNRSDDDILDYPSFNDIKEQLNILLSGTKISNIPLDQEDIPQYHQGIHLCIDNCKNNGKADGMIVRLLYPKEEQDIARAFIVVGGQTLSRGLTIEGLVSTYFLRAVKQADTLMQMGRWFGYRRGYETLPRIWMTERIKDQFIFLSKLDKKLRDELRRMEDLGIAPERYGPRVLSHPMASILKITAKNRMQEAVGTDYSGVASQTIIFDNNGVTLEDNLKQTESFLSNLHAPEEHKDCNKHSAHSIVWKNVEFGTVRNYLESFHYSTQQSAFNDIKRMMLWFDNLTNSGKLGNWNIVLAGVDKDKASGYWTPFDVAKVCRTNKKQHKQDTLNIGTLRAPKDVLADVDLEGATPELISLVRNFDAKNVFDIRNMAGLGKTPQLLIYIIDKNSKAKANSKTREDLGAQADVVGLCINVPEDRKRSNDNMVAIPINDDMFDFIEKVDE